MTTLEIPISKAKKPTTQAVDGEALEFNNRNPANIPSLQKIPTQRKSKKHRVKNLKLEVRPELQDLFEQDEEMKAAQMPTVPPPPKPVSEAAEVTKQVMEALALRRAKKLSEMI